MWWIILHRALGMSRAFTSATYTSISNNFDTTSYQCATLITTVVTNVLQLFTLQFKVSSTVLIKI
jgi:hypothetical protein